MFGLLENYRWWRFHGSGLMQGFKIVGSIFVLECSMSILGHHCASVFLIFVRKYRKYTINRWGVVYAVCASTVILHLKQYLGPRNKLAWKLCHTLHWRHNDHDGDSNHQPHGCLLNRLFRRRSKKTSQLRVTGLCVGNSPGPVNSPHKRPVTRKMFPFDDVIMQVEAFLFISDTCSCWLILLFYM